MKRILLLTVICTLYTGPALAQGGYIDLYSDPAGTDCFVTDAAPGIVVVYVIHQLTPGTTASQWKVQNNTPMAYLSFTTPFLMLGNPDVGAGISYQACLASPIAVGFLQYFGSGLSPTCSSLQVVPDPLAITGTIEVVDCALVKWIGGGGGVIVNGNPIACPCLFIDPVEETTWGGLKSLYE